VCLANGLRRGIADHRPWFSNTDWLTAAAPHPASGPFGPRVAVALIVSRESAPAFASLPSSKDPLKPHSQLSRFLWDRGPDRSRARKKDDGKPLRLFLPISLRADRSTGGLRSVRDSSRASENDASREGQGLDKDEARRSHSTSRRLPEATGQGLSPIRNGLIGADTQAELEKGHRGALDASQIEVRRRNLASPGIPRREFRAPIEERAQSGHLVLIEAQFVGLDTRRKTGAPERMAQARNARKVTRGNFSPSLPSACSVAPKGGWPGSRARPRFRCA